MIAENTLHTGPLPEGHAWLNHEKHRCVKCAAVVHTWDNKCVVPWIEAEDGPICKPCFDKQP